MDKKKKKAIIEAALFSVGEAVEKKRLSALIDESEGGCSALIDEMKKEWEKEKRGITIVSLEDSYQMCTCQDMYEYIIELTKSNRQQALSDSALETLSIIAYKQPVTRLDIEKIRGVSCDHAVNRLLEYDLIKELGRLDAPGKPILFGTTEQFLRTFGVESLEELPELSAIQIETFREEAEAEVELKI